MHVPQLGESLSLAGAEAEQGLGCEGRGVVDGHDQGRTRGSEREGTKAQHLQILVGQEDADVKEYVWESRYRLVLILLGPASGETRRQECSLFSAIPPTACRQFIMLHSSKSSFRHFHSESLPQESLLSPPPLLPPSHCTHPLLLLGELPDSRLNTRNIKNQKTQYSSSSTSSPPSPQLKPQNSHGPDTRRRCKDAAMLRAVSCHEPPDHTVLTFKVGVHPCRALPTTISREKAVDIHNCFWDN